jgi:hypothetical protein
LNDQQFLLLNDNNINNAPVIDFQNDTSNKSYSLVRLDSNLNQDNNFKLPISSYQHPQQQQQQLILNNEHTNFETFTTTTTTNTTNIDSSIIDSSTQKKKKNKKNSSKFHKLR